MAEIKGNLTIGRNLGIGAAPASNLSLDITSTTKAFAPPRMTTAQRDAISTPSEGMVIFNTTTHTLNQRTDSAWAAVGSGASVTESIIIAASDETTTLTDGVSKVTFRMPYALTLSAVRASVNSASTVGAITIDINEGGTSILSTKLTIDATEKTSTTAATPAVISDSALADDAEITVDIDNCGANAKGLKIALIGVKP